MAAFDTMPLAVFFK